MHWDMEGTSGLFHRDEAWYWYPGVSEETREAGRKLLIADVNNAVAAALDAEAYLRDTPVDAEAHWEGDPDKMEAAAEKAAS